MTSDVELKGNNTVMLWYNHMIAGMLRIGAVKNKCIIHEYSPQELRPQPSLAKPAIKSYIVFVN